ncbi:hypothetical protein SAMN05216296_1241 [Pseudomonas pohangensis]|uniref:Uncharacterized protein n=1 Tax=Pseudomonas pohangensis TaxID=364197 RepID=A0A1H2F147_9PSED|nr:hypothetical protein SAMN05216296_1241 [Pseudomonas pohangensis]
MGSSDCSIRQPAVIGAGCLMALPETSFAF